MKTRDDSYAVYNVIEQAIPEKETNSTQLANANIKREEIDKLLHEIKRVAILLQRSKPAEWNSLNSYGNNITSISII